MTPSKSYNFFLCHFVLMFYMHRAKVLKPYLSAAHWIPLSINPYANLMAVFFTALEEEGVQDEDLEKPSEMYVYAHSLWVISTETVSSDKIEELKIFADIMKLIPSFKDVIMACSDHQRALVNLIRMVSFRLL